MLGGEPCCCCCSWVSGGPGWDGPDEGREVELDGEWSARKGRQGMKRKGRETNLMIWVY